MLIIKPPSGEEAKFTVAEKTSLLNSVEQLRKDMEIIRGRLEANSVSDVPNTPVKKVPNTPYYTTGKYLQDVKPPTDKQVEMYMSCYGKPPLGLTKGQTWLKIWEFYH